jgi:uncharacterized protein with HEPN domain
MLPAEDRIRLQHMLDAAQQAQNLIAGHERGDLTTDVQLSLALQRLIEIIGEAATKVSAETRSQAADIEWAEIAGMRNRLIHAYFDVNLDLLWDTLTDDLPPLINSLESLLKTEPPKS